MSIRKVLSLILLGSLFGLPVCLAQETRWAIRASGFYVAPGDTPRVRLSESVIVSSDNTSAGGLGISAEYRFGERLGIELSVLAADHGDFFLVIEPPGRRFKVGDTLSFEAVAGGIDFHLIPDSTVDLYVGPMIAIVSYSDLAVEFTPPVRPPAVLPTAVTIGFESDLGYGLNAGLDVPLGDRGWVFNTNFRYLLTSAEASVAGLGTEKIDYDPLLAGIGFGYRF